MFRQSSRLVGFGALSAAAAMYHQHQSLALAKESDFKSQWETTVRKMQSEICRAVEKIDGVGKFKEDVWKRESMGAGVDPRAQRGRSV
ncbi:hypothetical protein BASA81_003835 [Batrachochytrium salamandrivorans]|nr:hypothetical protein BASA81_003835 [Batrachochytrium salamandrivorans]